MRRAAIVSPIRSAVGVYGGSLRPVPVEKLAKKYGIPRADADANAVRSHQRAAEA